MMGAGLPVAFAANVATSPQVPAALFVVILAGQAIVGALPTVTAVWLELADGHIPLCTTARNWVVCISAPVFNGLSVEAMSVQVPPPSVDFCHFWIAPI